MRPVCIVCKRNISPQTITHYIRRKGHQYPKDAAVTGDFKVKAELQPFLKHAIVALRYDGAGFVQRVMTWDGESYKDRYFCSNPCAMRQGYASANAGRRYSWD